MSLPRIYLHHTPYNFLHAHLDRNSHTSHSSFTSPPPTRNQRPTSQWTYFMSVRKLGVVLTLVFQFFFRRAFEPVSVYQLSAECGFMSSTRDLSLSHLLFLVSLRSNISMNYTPKLSWYARLHMMFAKKGPLWTRPRFNFFNLLLL